MADDAFLVIAHRGASGYLPEHTLPAYAMAYGIGADYIEQDVVLSRDHQPVVLHDVHIDTTTDVVVQFPDRKRKDGRYYAIDFDLAELKQLRVSERFDPDSQQPVYADRFPLHSDATFRIPTLDEAIALVQGLNRSTGRNVGVYPEIKMPAWHRQQGYDPSTVILKTLGQYGYTGDQPDEPRVFVQCFESDELIRIHRELGCRLPLIQLLGGDQAALLSDDGLKQVAEYAVGIGPALGMFAKFDRLETRAVVEKIHAAGLQIHPYTLRREMPEHRQVIEQLVAAGFDGAFTDHPDICLEVLANLRSN